MLARGALLVTPQNSTHRILRSKSFTIRTSEKCGCNPCRIRTSKTQDLKSFRIRTCEKNVFFFCYG